MNAGSETVEAVPVDESLPDFETVFYLHFDRIARAINRVVGDAACAEELATETFWRYWKTSTAAGENAGGWLYRTAIHLAIGELRRRARHARYQRLFHLVAPSTPEEIHAAVQEQERVRRVLGAIKPRDAELLILRSDDFSYEELAAALGLNPASIGTLIARARQTFRKEYTRLYGEPRNLGY